jgi:CubicO group peptidase (beta-lactamase class C family)
MRHARSTSGALVVLFLTFFAAVLPAQETPLSLGSPVRGSVAPGDTAVFTFSAEADAFVRAAVEQLTVDVSVRVLGPDGEAVDRASGPERGFERFQFETEAAGVHRIQVTPVGEEEGGDFVVTLERLEPVATDPAALADQLLSLYDREDSPGAAVSVFRDGERLFAKAYGMADLTYGIPFELDTPTNIGSTSKQFTALAVMLLVERGELSLDDDVRTYIPELPDFGDTVRVRNLLTHTTGYREFLNLLIMSGRRLEHGDLIEREELIQVVQRQPALQNEPGAEFNYNNTGYGLAAVVV